MGRINHHAGATFVSEGALDVDCRSTSNTIRAVNAAVGGAQCHSSSVAVSTHPVLQDNGLTGVTAASAHRLKAAASYWTDVWRAAARDKETRGCTPPTGNFFFC